MAFWGLYFSRLLVAANPSQRAETVLFPGGCWLEREGIVCFALCILLEGRYSKMWKNVCCLRFEEGRTCAVFACFAEGKRGLGKSTNCSCRVGKLNYHTKTSDYCSNTVIIIEPP